MKKFYFFIFGVILFGCSVVVEKPQQSYPQIGTMSFLPPKWTETITPTATHTKMSTPTFTRTGLDTKTITSTTDLLRYYEIVVSPHFSYIPPKGWQKVIGDLRYKFPTFWHTLDYDGVLFFSMNNTTMTAKNFLQSQHTAIRDMEIVSEGPFNNAAGLEAYRIIMQSSSKKEEFTKYAFHKREFVLEGIYLCLMENRSVSDKLIEQTMYSLQFEM